ncbi:MAG: type pilus biosis protein [Lacunisphaera sp.]|nr:type pilus biosis protein [Lacunisphaera sp.]
MQTKRILGLWLAAAGIFLGTASLRAAEPDIEFTGFVRDDAGLMLALRNPKTGYAKWVAVGRSFEDYTVARLDEKTEVLVVTKAGAEFQLALMHSKITQANPPAEPPPEIKKRVLNNLRQLAAAADQFYLENGVSRASYDDLVGAKKYVREVLPVDGENYRSIQFQQGNKIETTTSQGYLISYLP